MVAYHLKRTWRDNSIEVCTYINYRAMPNKNVTKWRVGYIFSEKKLKHSGMLRLVEYALKHDMEFLPIDLSTSIKDQGPFDLIVHKITELIVSSEGGDIDSRRRLNNLLAYMEENPRTIFVDPLENIYKLLNRELTVEVLQRCRWNVEYDKAEPLFFVPNHIVLPTTSVPLPRRAHFPIICKRISACSSQIAHEMILVPSATAFTPEQVNIDEPVMLQNFINHDGILFKIYVLGDRIFVDVRPSLNNVDRTTVSKPVHFDSQKIPKSFVTSSRNGENRSSHQVSGNGSSLEEPMWLSAFSAKNLNQLREKKEALFDRGRVKAMAKAIGHHLGVSLFGFDVIIESNTARHYVIDVNYFPSYDNVPEFHEVFLETLRLHIQAQQ